MPLEKTRVLVVEDNMINASYFAIALRTLGYSVCGMAATADQAVKMAETHDPSAILMDVRLKGERDGVDAANEIHSRAPETKIIYVTGSNEPATMARIDKDHPSAVMVKPVLATQLAEQLKTVLQ